MRSTTCGRSHWGTSMRWLTTALIVFTLAGCGLARQAEIKQAADQAQAQLGVGHVECERQYPDKYKRPVTPRVKCFNAANDRYNNAMARSVSNPVLDLHDAHHARRLVAAERYDKGELSQAEYELAMANSRTEATSQANDRNNKAAAVSAQQQAAAAQQSQAAIARGRAIQDAFNPRTQTTNTNCNSVGNSVNCRSTSY